MRSWIAEWGDLAFLGIVTAWIGGSFVFSLAYMVSLVTGDSPLKATVILVASIAVLLGVMLAGDALAKHRRES